MYNFNNLQKIKKAIFIKHFYIYVNANNYVDNLLKLSDLLDTFYFIHKISNQITTYQQLKIICFY